MKFSDLFKSDTADRLGIDLYVECDKADNTSLLHIKYNLKELFKRLKYVESLFDERIIITSGYRNHKVNYAVGGVKNSKHLIGLAADITCMHIDSLYDLLLRCHCFDEVKYYPERNYIHVALKRKDDLKMFDNLNWYESLQNVENS